MDYSELMDDLDCAVFSGELLETHIDEFQEFVSRWQRAIDSHKENCQCHCEGVCTVCGCVE